MLESILAVVVGFLIGEGILYGSKYLIYSRRFYKDPDSGLRVYLDFPFFWHDLDLIQQEKQLRAAGFRQVRRSEFYAD